MNYFIDFDHTLYNTNLTTEALLSSLADFISKNSKENYSSILECLKAKFKRGQIYDIYALASYSSKKYSVKESEAVSIINQTLINGKKYLFEDSIPFLKYLKSKGNKIYICSYNENKIYYQALKITGSGLLNYVDGIFPTIIQKSRLPVDFKHSIFIDDKPKDLIYIYNKKPYKIYRIRRPGDTYSGLETNLPIPEFSSLEELKKEIT